MEKMIPKTFRQFLALLLCAAMLVPMIPSPVFATEVTEPVVAGTEAVPETTEPAGTDAAEAVPETTEPAGTDATEAAPAATIPAMKEIVMPGSEEPGRMSYLCWLTAYRTAPSWQALTSRPWVAAKKLPMTEQHPVCPQFWTRF